MEYRTYRTQGQISLAESNTFWFSTTYYVWGTVRRVARSFYLYGDRFFFSPKKNINSLLLLSFDIEVLDI